VFRGALRGVDLSGEQYQNVNFSLFRILIPVLIGAVTVSMTAPSGVEADTDDLSGAQTTQAYRDYVTDHVFAPANVVDARTASSPGDAPAYRRSLPAGGWDSGDLAAVSGTVAWRPSANDLVRVLQAFADELVVARSRMHLMLDGGWGIDQAGVTRARSPVGRG
jgi:hypothetical protein